MKLGFNGDGARTACAAFQIGPLEVADGRTLGTVSRVGPIQHPRRRSEFEGGLTDPRAQLVSLAAEPSSYLQRCPRGQVIERFSPKRRRQVLQRRSGSSRRRPRALQRLIPRT
jgi:hypothetical protein